MMINQKENYLQRKRLIPILIVLNIQVNSIFYFYKYKNCINLILIINLYQLKYFINLIKLITNLESDEDEVFNKTLSLKRTAGWSPSPNKKGNSIFYLNYV